MVQVGFDFALPHILGMSLAVKKDVLADPEDIRLLGFRAEMLLATGNPDLL